MARSAMMIANSSAVAIGAILLTVATLTEWAARPISAAQPAPGESGLSMISAGGVTLRSVSVNLPDSNRTFPGGALADVMNNNCLACHSTGMVLVQPRLSRAAWEAEVDKMRNTYKAPIAAADVPAIVDYLVTLDGER